LGAANDGLRFLLELAVLAAVGSWGFTVADGAARWLLGLGAPLLVAVVWGLFVAPKASLHVDDPLRLLLEVVIFGSAVAALQATGHRTLAIVLGAVVALHLGFTFVLDQR
jgi:hypothetical protein